MIRRKIEITKKVVTYETSIHTFEMSDNQYENFKDFLKTLEIKSENELTNQIREYFDNHDIVYNDDIEYDVSMDTDEIIDTEVVKPYLEILDSISYENIKKYK